MRLMGTTPPNIEYLAAAYGIGAPGGAVLVILSWWLMTGAGDPSLVQQEGESIPVMVHVLATGLWAPLLIGIASLRLVDRLGWDGPSGN